MTAVGNEALFREVNERIRRLDLSGPDEPAEYLCECPRLDCLELFPVPKDVYDRVRLLPGRFVVVPGHEGASDRIVARGGAFLVVELAGAAVAAEN